MTNSRLYQLSTIGALSEKVYDSDTSCAELSKHGDFGLGTFNHLDGELIVLDGKFYQVTPDSRAKPADLAAKVPFTMLTFFKPKTTIQIRERCALTELEAGLDASIRSKNIFHAIKIDCEIETISLRVVMCQHAPYQAFKEVCDHEAEFKLTHLRGTLLGFRSPRFASEFTATGYHLHFIDSDCSHGGHVFDAILSNATIQIQELSHVELQLLETNAYLNANLEKTYANTFETLETGSASPKEPN